MIVTHEVLLYTAPKRSSQWVPCEMIRTDENGSHYVRLQGGTELGPCAPDAVRPIKSRDDGQGNLFG